MKTATILPTKYLPFLADETYHMCLAHLIGSDEQYTRFYADMAKKGRYVIMDNGVIEGDPRPIEEIVKKATMIKANEIVLPDVYMNMEATLEKTYNAIKYVKGNFPFKLMGVPQGKTFDEWLQCAEAMVLLDIDVIGIPKVLTSLGGRDARTEALAILGNRLRGLEIHMLGCWNTILEATLIECAVRDEIIPKVRGIDSAIAYVYAKAGIGLDEDERPNVKFNFDETDVNYILLAKNIHMWNCACKVPKYSEIPIEEED
jgi:hypothetical protein